MDPPAPSYAGLLPLFFLTGLKNKNFNDTLILQILNLLRNLLLILNHQSHLLILIHHLLPLLHLKQAFKLISKGLFSFDFIVFWPKLIFHQNHYLSHELIFSIIKPFQLIIFIRFFMGPCY